MSENDSVRSMELMRDHLKSITSRYQDICIDMSDLEEDVNGAVDLDRLLRIGDFDEQEIDPTFSYFGLQLKNVSFALKSVAATLKNRAESLKKSSLFPLEKSMHTGESILELFKSHYNGLFPCLETTAVCILSADTLQTRTMSKMRTQTRHRHKHSIIFLKKDTEQTQTFKYFKSITLTCVK